MLSEIMLGGPLQILTRLLEAAQVAVREPGKYSKELLEDLTFDSTWLQEQKAEFNNTGRLLMAVVSNAVCGISFLEPECFAILERSLPQIGWQAGDTELLLRGDSFYKFIESLNVPEFLIHMNPHNKELGWLGENRIRYLTQNLAKSQSFFYQPSNELLKLVTAGRRPEDFDAKYFLRTSYDQAIGLLGDGRCEVFLYNDVISYKVAGTC